MILIDRTIPLLTELLAPLDEVRTFDHHRLDRELLVQTHCRALFIRSTVRITRSLLDGTAVQFIGSVTSGSDHIASDIAGDPRYVVALAGGANANAVAEYVLASVLLWCSREGVAPEEQTIGIVGFGNIGRRVAEYMHRLGLRIVVSDPPLQDAGFAFPSYVGVAALDEVLAGSTILTNHVPLVLSGPYPTHGLLDARRLRRSAARLIVHTSRGGIVTERGLLDALRRGVAVAVDVWEHEPNVSPALARRALVATPHIAGHSINAKLHASVLVAQQYYAFCGATFVRPSLDLPPRRLLTGRIAPHTVLDELLRARQFDRDTDQLRRIVRLPPSERCLAIEHFRATYPARTEVFRTSYDD